MIHGSNATGSSSAFSSMQDTLTDSVPRRCDDTGDIEARGAHHIGEKVVSNPTTKLSSYVIGAITLITLALLALLIVVPGDALERRRLGGCCVPSKLCCSKWANWGLPFVFLFLILAIYLYFIHTNGDGNVAMDSWNSMCVMIRDGDSNLQATIVSTGVLVAAMSCIALLIMIIGALMCFGGGEGGGSSSGCSGCLVCIDCNCVDNEENYKKKEEKSTCAMTTFKTVISAFTVVPAALMTYGLTAGAGDEPQEGGLGAVGVDNEAPHATGGFTFSYETANEELEFPVGYTRMVETLGGTEKLTTKVEGGTTSITISRDNVVESGVLYGDLLKEFQDNDHFDVKRKVVTIDDIATHADKETTLLVLVGLIASIGLVWLLITCCCLFKCNKDSQVAEDSPKGIVASWDSQVAPKKLTPYQKYCSC